MKAIYDLNVLLDVIQHRDKFYAASAAALNKSLDGEWTGIIPSHAVTTLHYLLTRYVNKQKADEGVDFLIDNFVVVSADTETFRRARQLAFNDFEDAVVTAIAIKAKCDVIVTRNIADFKHAPVQVLLPGEL